MSTLSKYSGWEQMIYKNKKIENFRIDLLIMQSKSNIISVSELFMQIWITYVCYFKCIHRHRRTHTQENRSGRHTEMATHETVIITNSRGLKGKGCNWIISKLSVSIGFASVWAENNRLAQFAVWWSTLSILLYVCVAGSSVLFTENI